MKQLVAANVVRIIVSSLTLAAGVTMTSAPSWADAWRLQKYPKDKFQVEWSGPVRIEVTELPSSTQKLVDHAAAYMQDEPAAYSVGVALGLPSSKTSLQGYAEATFKKYECNQIDKKSIVLKNTEAVEWIGANCREGWRVRARIFHKGNWLYGVFAVVDSDGDVDAAQHFLESFKIIED